MKQLVCAGFLFLLLPITAQEMEKDPITCTELHLKDAVKTLTENAFIETRNPQGKVVLTKGHRNSWDSDYQLEFDEQGNLLKKTRMNAAPARQHEAYTYENGRLKQSVTFYHTTDYVYDEQGRIAETTVESRQPGTITDKTTDELTTPRTVRITWVYNELNQVVKKIHYDLQDHSSEVQSLSYKNGLLVYEEMVAEDYSSKDWFNYNYDASGNLIEMTWTDSEDGLLERTTYSYKEGQLTEEKWELFDEGELESSVVYTYVGGNPVKVVDTDADGEIVSTEVNTYTFDKHGNWISCRSVENKKVYVIKRTLTYY